MADRDQAAAESDQRVSDRDQEASDRQLRADPSPDPAALQAYRQAQVDRGEGTMARLATTAVRAQIAAERQEQARRRDDIAERRDETATARDREAEQADEAAEEMAGELGTDSPAAKVATVARASAAAARSHAARDRERAARDREAAGRDRELLMAEIERSQMDDLTGAYGRRIGEVLLRHELERAQRMRRGLTLGVFALGTSKSGASGFGPPTFSAPLADSFAALQVRLRPYDPIVRWSEDEFVCAIAEVPASDARRRLDGARSDVVQRHPDATIAIGMTPLEDGDGLDLLVKRAKADLTE